MGNSTNEEMKNSVAAKDNSVETKPEIISEKSEKVKSKFSKKLIFAVLFTAIALLLVYFGGVWYFENHFFTNAVINQVYCGKLTSAAATEKVQNWYAEQYSLEIKDREGKVLLAVLPEDAGMTFSAGDAVVQALEKQNAWLWPGQLFEKADRETEAAVMITYDKSMLKRYLYKAGLFDRTAQEAPQDASIGDYQAEAKAYGVIPEVQGTFLKETETFLAAMDAVSTAKAELNLEKADCYVQPKVTLDDADLQEKLQKLNQMVSTRIVYDWNGNEEILDGDRIQEWLIFDGNTFTLNEEQVAAYVTEMSKKHDTYGKKRKFVTALGVELTLPSGAYGWKTDRGAEKEALMELILEGTVTTREPEYQKQGWVKGQNDIGDSYIEIDLSNQHLYMYEDGEIIFETDFVSGDAATGHMTPPGVFGITYKKTEAVLRGADYETPVHYWMPFNGDVGMHDATWRRKFGGDIFLTNGSHGCVNLPLSAAKVIFEYVSKGFPVICYYY